MLIRFHDTKEENFVTLCLELFPFLNILGVRHSEQMPQDGPCYEIFNIIQPLNVVLSV